METIKLKAKARPELGKELVKKLRKHDLIPAVVYKGKNSLNIKVATKDFLELLKTKAGSNVLVDLEIEGESAKAKTAIIKEIQYHPVKGDILHVDFNEISLTEALTVKVPILVEGEPQGIKEGGVLEHVLWEVEIECLPTQIPENIPVDVSSLKIGDSILVKNLLAPEGVKILSDPEATVITVAVPRAAEEELKPAEAVQVEPEVIMERKPKEEEAAAEEAEEKEPEKQKKEKT